MRSASPYYVYAIVRGDAPLPVGVLPGGVPLTTVPWRDLAAVTSRVAGESESLTLDAALHHESVVEAVRRVGPALPVRFGTVFRDAGAVTGALAQRYQQLVTDLERIGDKVELSVIALWSTPSDNVAEIAPSPDDMTTRWQGTGSRYLRTRAAEFRRSDSLKERARALAARLDDALSEWTLDRRASLVPTQRVAMRTAYLVDPARADAFRAAFEAVRPNERDVRLLLTGPWPPYSFAKRAQSELAQLNISSIRSSNVDLQA